MDGARTVQDSRIGRIVAVSGSQIVTMLDDALVAEGTGRLELDMGSVIKIRTPATTVYGMVGGLNIPLPAHSAGDREMKFIEIDLLGECAHGKDGRQLRFRRGVSIVPSLSDAVYTATKDDLARIYAAAHETAVRVGSIHQDRSLPAYVSPDDLLGKHCAVLGTTGSGKSCAVALILQAILGKYSNGHIVLLDMHNEYSHAFGDLAEVLDTTRLELPYWLLNFEEIEEIVIGREKADREAMSAILGEVILAAKRMFTSDPRVREIVTVDAPVPYRLGDLLRLIDEAVGKLDKARETAPYLRLKARIDVLQSDPRYHFMFPGLTVQDKMTAILSQIFRVPVAGKPITIIDLSGVPSEILNVVIAVLCRMTFEFAIWSDRGMPVMLVCEEAHRYASQDTRLGFEPTKRALARIAKEGRKYGVSLCLVSQRPSELAVEVLSQCNTIFALRMSNQKDQEFVRATLSESSIGLLDFLPSLGNAEAIAVGEGVSVPMRLCFDDVPAEQRPRSGTASFSAAWSQEITDPNFLPMVVARWRAQGR
jgi:DNA helicase HerA-like ATPase